MAGGNVQRDEIVRIAKNVSSKATYPVSSFDELAQALGGQNASVRVAGKDYIVGQGRSLLPAAVFPITSEGDFITKITNLQSGGAPSMQGDLGLTEQQQAPLDEDEIPRAAPSGPWC